MPTPIQTYATAQAAVNKRVADATAGLTGDIEGLNALIKTLQDSQGTISPEDQTTLDQLQAAGEAMATKIEALDAITPPVVPPAL